MCVYRQNSFKPTNLGHLYQSKSAMPNADLTLIELNMQTYSKPSNYI